jgi:hypothetical protein
VTASPLKGDVFESLWEERESAVKNLNEFKLKKKATMTTITKQGDGARGAREEGHGCHQPVHDIRPLRSTAFAPSEEFAHLLKVTMPTPQDTTMKLSST